MVQFSFLLYWFLLLSYFFPFVDLNCYFLVFKDKCLGHSFSVLSRMSFEYAFEAIIFLSMLIYPTWFFVFVFFFSVRDKTQDLMYPRKVPSHRTDPTLYPCENHCNLIVILLCRACFSCDSPLWKLCGVLKDLRPNVCGNFPHSVTWFLLLSLSNQKVTQKVLSVDLINLKLTEGPSNFFSLLRYGFSVYPWLS